MFFAPLLALLALPAVFGQSSQFSQAVSKLAYPPSRGSNPLVSGINPCQGYAMGGRVDYPLTGGRVSWENIRDLKNVQIAYSRSDNPTQQSDFVGVGSNLTVSYIGSQCVNGPDFASLGLQPGDKVTLQLAWTAGAQNRPGYECADLNLVSASNFAAANWTVTCENKITTTQTRGTANPRLSELQAQASAESSSSSSGLTRVQAGAVGAMVSLAAVLLVLAAAYFAGFAIFGKSAKKAKRSQNERAMNDHLTEKTVSSV